MIHKVVVTCCDGCHIFTHCGIYVKTTTTGKKGYFRGRHRVGVKTWSRVTCKNYLKTKK